MPTANILNNNTSFSQMNTYDNFGCGKSGYSNLNYTNQNNTNINNNTDDILDYCDKYTNGTILNYEEEYYMGDTCENKEPI